MRKRLEIPVTRVRSVLRYEPETGDFFWKEKIADKVVVGRKAGNATGNRTVRISIDGVIYDAHRLAWAIMTGEQPPDVIDHIDCNSRNNRWINLREATISENGANRGRQANNRSGVKGVYYYPQKGSKPWLARMSVQGKIVLNKLHATKEQAAKSYAVAAKKHFGEFARV